MLIEFKQGIHDFNEEFNLAETSVNLAIINFENGEAQIECSSRGMNAVGLDKINNTTSRLFSKYGFQHNMEYKYPAWKPEINTFTASVNDAMVTIFGESKYEAIHAGLECGVLLERYPNIKFASIGPTIVYPHSTREGVKLDSVGKIFEVVKHIINKLS
jgi:dipeptidase D